MISIIIPTLQEARLLPQILEQFPEKLCAEFDLELIISDGGSTDDTLAIAERYGTCIVRHDESRRQTIAEGRNRGAATARGEILVFINADIRISDMHAFLSCIPEVLAAEGVAGATAPVHVFPEEEITADRIFHVWHNAYVRFLNFIGEGMGRGECQVLMTEMFHAVGGYNPSMVAGEDYDLFRRVRKRGKIVMLKNVTIFESPRRFRRYGYLHILWGWTRNALAVIFRNSSSSEEWEAVR